MSMLTWRLLQDLIPVEDVMQRRGIQMASKCVCCTEVETIEHVFFSNPIARRVWSHFGALFGCTARVDTVWDALRVWSCSAPSRGHVRQLLPVVVLWALWEARNKAKHEEVRYNFGQILHRITRTIHLLAQTFLTSLVQWRGDVGVAYHFQATVSVPSPKAPLVVGWVRPTSGRLKLNVDGSLSSQGAGAGGVLRNHDGALVVAFSFQITAHDSYEAEVEAAYRALTWCTNNSYVGLEVEVDSLQLCQAIQQRKGPWHLLSKITILGQLVSSTCCSLVHVFREGNKAADHMAKISAQHGEDVVWRPGEEDATLRAIVRLEQLGIPYIRNRE